MIRYTYVIYIALACLIAGCGRSDVYRTDSGVIWNTSYHITYRGDKAMADSILATLNDVELSVSPFNSRSLVSAVNRGEDVVADGHLTRMITESQRICRLSGGAFDPTLAPLINLWGFGYDHDDAEVTDERITEVMQSVGILDCGVDDEGRVMRKSDSTEFNFSAIAKGYGCDCVGRMFERNGITDYMIEIGGEIVVAGRSPRGDVWNIQIDAPETDNLDSSNALTVISVTDCGVATSGNYRNYRVDSDGRHYGHTISVVTGRPVETRTLSATVIATTAMEADALATAAMSMPPDEAVAMFDSLDGAECMLVIGGRENPSDSDPHYIIRYSKGWGTKIGCDNS